ncbi:hypothetical protein ISCGN_013321 [Ixodes scapularis]
MKLLMFFVLPQFLSVSARGSPTNWSHDDGAVFFRHPDDNLQPANHWSTAPSCLGIKFIENLVHTTSSAGTSTAAAIMELPLRQRASGHGGSAAVKLLMFFVLPQFLSVSARGSPTNWSHDDGAVFFRHPDDNLQPANHWSTAPSCLGIKFIENLVHTTSSAGTSTAAAIMELPLRQRASGHGGSAAVKLLMFFVLPQFLSVSARGSPTNWSHDDGAVFFRHPDDILQPANHWSTAPSCLGIKFIENLVHTTSSAGTSTAAAIMELPLRQRASGHGGSAAVKLLMFFVLPQFLSVSARGSPTNWSHDDGAVFFRHPDDNLQPANHWSTAPSCLGIKFIENLVHTTSSAGTSTAAAIKELPLRQRASGHGGSAAMKLLMFFVLPQIFTSFLLPVDLFSRTSLPGCLPRQPASFVICDLFSEHYSVYLNFSASIPLGRYAISSPSTSKEPSRPVPLLGTEIASGRGSFERMRSQSNPVVFLQQIPRTTIEEVGVKRFQNAAGMNLGSILELLGVYLTATVVSNQDQARTWVRARRGCRAAQTGAGCNFLAAKAGCTILGKVFRRLEGPSAATALQKQQLENILHPFATMFTETPGKTDVFLHHIETGNARPLCCHPRALSVHKRALLDAALQEMLDTGTVQEPQSPWASGTLALLVVWAPKKDGSVRLCVDYRRLNAVRIFTSFLLPVDLFSRTSLPGCLPRQPASFVICDLFSEHYSVYLNFSASIPLGRYAISSPSTSKEPSRPVPLLGTEIASGRGSFERMRSQSNPVVFLQQIPRTTIEEVGVKRFQNAAGMNLGSILELLGVYLTATVVSNQDQARTWVRARRGCRAAQTGAGCNFLAAKAGCTILGKVFRRLEGPSAATALQKQQLENILHPFATMFTETPGKTDVFLHHIETGNARPLCCHPRALSVHKRALLDAALQEMLDTGTVQEPQSPWASGTLALLVVWAPKKDGSVRLCVDYRRLNAVRIVNSAADEFRVHAVHISHVDFLALRWDHIGGGGLSIQAMQSRLGQCRLSPVPNSDSSGQEADLCLAA